MHQEDLQTEAGRDKLAAIARRYYEITHAAVRRYDTNHLILGYRFLGNSDISDIVLDVMGGTVDVLSIQYRGNFSTERPHITRWHSRTGLPVLMADAVMPPQYYTPPTQERRGLAYMRYIREALSHEAIVGIHFCGAYLENDVRGWGVKSARDEPYPGITDAFASIHRDVYRIGTSEL